jgi:hypothetical protein
MMLTLTLAAGMLAAPEPQKGWVVEIHNFTYRPKQTEPRKEFIIEFQWPKAKPQPKPVEGRYQPVEGQYYDDLSAFFNQQSMQVKVVEAFYVDDLPAYFRQLKNR